MNGGVMMDRGFQRRIASGFPYPIAVSFKRINTADAIKSDEIKLYRILSAAEVIAVFLGSIVLCECREMVEKTKCRPSENLSGDILRKINKPSFGSWIFFVREGLRWINANDFEPTVNDLRDFYFKKKNRESDSAVSLNKLVEIRNNLEHGGLKNATPNELRMLCGETFGHLSIILQALDFLESYMLFYAKPIQVDKRRLKKPNFLHTLNLLVGESDELSAEDRDFPDPTESNDVILLHELDNKFLNLTPFIVYEEYAVNNRDLFYYNGNEDIERQKITYAPFK
ncbi:MAG: hypothetical protein HQL02_08175 [Nitrospirae bacterium]|nr:hypothetical protein [Nitrospirota bacterium]